MAVQRFFEKTSDYLSNSKVKSRDPAWFKSAIDGVLLKACSEAVREAKSHTDIAGAQNWVDTKVTENRAWAKDELYNQYRDLYDQNTKLIDIFLAEAKADFWEKMRFFCFRMATAIGFAAVVLATAWLAGRWGIQLPLSGLRAP